MGSMRLPSSAAAVCSKPTVDLCIGESTLPDEEQRSRGAEEQVCWKHRRRLWSRGRQALSVHLSQQIEASIPGPILTTRHLP